MARRAVLTLLLFPPSSDADKEEKAAKDAAKAAKAAAQQEKELGNDCYKARTLKRLQGAAVPDSPAALRARSSTRPSRTTTRPSSWTRRCVSIACAFTSARPTDARAGHFVLDQPCGCAVRAGQVRRVHQGAPRRGRRRERRL